MQDENKILGNLDINILLNLKIFFLLKNIYRIIALNQDDIDVAIGIIIKPTFLKNIILINIFIITETKEI